MKFQLRRCPDCKRYTLREQCPKCDSKTVTAHPAKFSPDDKYARYRIMDKFKKEN
jgi:H/ACA ribonucleoprotein complex subunit 3